jgi:hypothetical protein
MEIYRKICEICVEIFVGNQMCTKPEVDFLFRTVCLHAIFGIDVHIWNI